MWPVRMSVLTCNLWHKHSQPQQWTPQRRAALTAMLQTVKPDVACFQECTSETLKTIDSILPTHSRVMDRGEPGWETEGTIYWNKSLLSLECSGAEDVGIVEKDRRLFWARLSTVASSTPLFVSTAHLTYGGRQEELETGTSPRIGQARRIAHRLGDLIQPGEPSCFVGDLNDCWNAVKEIEKAQLKDCFSALRVAQPPTWPVVKPGPPQTLDWILVNDAVRVMACQVLVGQPGAEPPSDHHPVLAVLEIPGTAAAPAASRL